MTAVEESAAHGTPGGMESPDNPGGVVQTDMGPSVVDQQPTDMGMPVLPDLCGTFAVYLQPDGTAGLVLAVEGEPEPRRLLLPKMIVDMVIHGKKPSLKDAMGLLGGLR